MTPSYYFADDYDDIELTTETETTTTGNGFAFTAPGTLAPTSSKESNGDSTLLIVACAGVLAILSAICAIVLYYFCRRHVLAHGAPSDNGSWSHHSSDTDTVNNQSEKGGSSVSPQGLPTVQNAVDNSGSSGGQTQISSAPMDTSPTMRSKQLARFRSGMKQSRKNPSLYLSKESTASKMTKSKRRNEPIKARQSALRKSVIRKSSARMSAIKAGPTTGKSTAGLVVMDKVTITPEMFANAPASKKEILLFKAASFNE